MDDDKNYKQAAPMAEDIVRYCRNGLAEYPADKYIYEANPDRYIELQLFRSVREELGLNAINEENLEVITGACAAALERVNKYIVIGGQIIKNKTSAKNLGDVVAPWTLCLLAISNHQDYKEWVRENVGSAFLFVCLYCLVIFRDKKKEAYIPEAEFNNPVSAAESYKTTIDSYGALLMAQDAYRLGMGLLEVLDENDRYQKNKPLLDMAQTVKEGGEKGHVIAHGTEDEKSERWVKYQHKVDEIYNKNPSWTFGRIKKEVAGSFRVSTRTIERNTNNPKKL